MDFKLVLPSIYINFNIQTKFEVNQTRIGHSIPKKTPKTHQSGHISKPHFSHVSFGFLDRMANLGLIGFKLGLYIKVNVNAGQNKFEVHISKNVAKMAVLWPKIR